MGGPIDKPERDEPSVVIEIIPDRPNATMELETADLKELTQHGTIAAHRQQVVRPLTRTVDKVIVQPQPRPNATVELSTKDIVDVPPAAPITAPAPGAYPTVIVALDERAPSPVPAPKFEPVLASPLAKRGAAQRATTVQTRERVGGGSQRVGAVMLVALYVVCAAALGLSIYFRYLA